MALFKNNEKEPEKEVENLFNVELTTSVQNLEEGETAAESRNGIHLDISYFGPLSTLAQDPNITDIDYNGSDLWITDVNNNHWKAIADEDLGVDENGKALHKLSELNPTMIRMLAHRVANSKNVEFNLKYPRLEAETDELRISILHSSIAQSGTSVCIRKIPTVERITEKDSIEKKYLTRKSMSLLANLVKAHLNIIIAGQPRAGKTELAKFISKYIPDEERVITIEDVMEWHYRELNPTSDAVEIMVNKDFDYSDGIIASLKQNPRWLMIAETRGKEVKDLITSFTTGVNGITTLHTDDVRKIPDRIVNMADDSVSAIRMKNNVYEFVNVGILVSMRTNAEGVNERFVDQVGFFYREDDKNYCQLILQDGKPYNDSLNSVIQKKMDQAGIKNIWENEDVDKYLEKQGYDFHSEIDDFVETKKFDFSEEDLLSGEFESSDSDLSIEERALLLKKKKEEYKGE